MARELFRYWDRYPPAHELLQAWIAPKERKQQRKRYGTREDLIRDIQALGGQIG